MIVVLMLFQIHRITKELMQDVSSSLLQKHTTNEQVCSLHIHKIGPSHTDLVSAYTTSILSSTDFLIKKPSSSGQ